MNPTTEETAALEQIWEAVIRIATLDGAAPMSKHAGLWERRIDDQWVIKVNGHRATVQDVPPFSFMVEFNGWPAGVAARCSRQAPPPMCSP